MTRKLDYLVFDADNHMYEATDAFTKYLPKEYEGVIKYVEVNGRTKIAIKNKISDYIPNPTFNKVAPPGAQELEFKLKNPDSMTAADKELQLAPPPKYIEALPGFFEPEIARSCQVITAQKTTNPRSSLIAADAPSSKLSGSV
jgi:hypothetical protein